MTGRLPLVRRAAILAAVFALAIGAAACSSSDSGSEDAGADTTVSTDTDATDTASSAPVDPQTEWVEHEAPPECECAHGDPYSYWTRTADPDKVVLYFQGGGACFSADMCAEGSDSYSQVA